MTLKDLILKYEFDTVVPDLLTVDEPVKDNLYAFKEAFDTLRRMVPGEDRQATSVTLSTDQRDFLPRCEQESQVELAGEALLPSHNIELIDRPSYY